MPKQVKHDLGGSFSERVRKHTGDSDIGNRHTVLDAVLFESPHADKFKTVSGDLPELAEIFWWDKGTSDKIKLKEISAPFGILPVGFFAFDGFDILGMSEAYVDISTTADGVGDFHHKNHRPFYQKG